MNPKLKPCPFCGNNAVTEYENEGSYYVHCSACNAGIIRTSQEDVRNAWNTRANESKVHIL